MIITDDKKLFDVALYQALQSELQTTSNEVSPFLGLQVQRAQDRSIFLH